MVKAKKVVIFFCLLFYQKVSVAVTQVDVELQLLVDISGSINTSEYDMQLQGYENAFRDQQLQNAIVNGTQGQIAVQLIMWSGPSQQEVMVDWTLVDSPTASNNLADVIASVARPFSGWTAIGSAIDFAAPLFDNNGFEGLAQIMDISGDGRNNSGSNLAQASQNAIASGVDTINGIVITDDQRVIDQYYQEVIAGDSPFLLSPATFDDFQLSIKQKVIAEINGTIPVDAQVVVVPEPHSIFMWLVMSIALLRCRTNCKGGKS